MRLAGYSPMVFLIAALGMFTAFHFMPLSISSHGDRGGFIWVIIWGEIRDPILLRDSEFAVACSSFLALSLLMVASPFLGHVWRKSVLAWAIVVIFSGVSVAGFWCTILKDLPVDLSWGGWFLMISPILNFVGLLLARGKAPNSEGVAQLNHSGR